MELTANPTGSRNGSALAKRGSTPSKRARARKYTSAVSNGSRLFVERPGDTAWHRRFRDILYQFIADAGGDVLSEAQRQLARRAATIAVMCERMEGQAAAGEDIDLNEYGMLTDRLGRTLQRLGLKRQARDVTPTLNEIMRERRPDIRPEAEDAADA
jgi:hypothetical protein